MMLTTPVCIVFTMMLCSRFISSYRSPLFNRRLANQLRQSFSIKAEKVETGHQAPSGGGPTLTADEEALVAKFKENQAAAKKLSFAEEVRTLIDTSICYGTISTNSVQYEGFPTGSIVGFELDDAGRPFFVFSSMSAHTKDILADDRASLTITAKDFKGAAEGRVVLIGTNWKKTYKERDYKVTFILP